MYTESIRNSFIAVAVATALSASAFAVAETPEATRLEAHSDGVIAAISDTMITTSVKSKLAGDTRLGKSDIDVTTTNGAVTLTGYAAGSEAKAAAAAIARSVDGVKSVHDDLKMPPAVATNMSSDAHEVASSVERVGSDSWITSKVKSEIAADSLTKGVNVGVTTRRGAVSLTGTLASFDAIEHVKGIAAKVKDVKSVDTTALKISKT